MNEPYDIRKRPDLAVVGVAGEHQSGSGPCGSLGFPRGVRDENGGGIRRAPRQRLLDEVAVLPVAAARGEVIDARDQQAGTQLGPLVAKHAEAGVFEQPYAAFKSSIEFVIASNRPQTERRREAAQERQEFALGFTMAFQNVATENDQVRPFRLDLGNALGQPTLPEQGAEVQVGGEHQHRAIALGRQIRELHLVAAHDRSTPRLQGANHAKHQAGQQRPSAKRRRDAGKKQAEPGDDVSRYETDKEKEQNANPVCAYNLKRPGQSAKSRAIQKARQQVTHPQNGGYNNQKPGGDMPGDDRYRGQTVEHIDVQPGPDKKDDPKKQSASPVTTKTAGLAGG